MTEIRNEEWRQTLRLAFNDSEERIAEAIRVIMSSGGLCAVVSKMLRSHFQNTLQQKFKGHNLKLPRGLDQPDYLCYVGYLQRLLIHIYNTRPEATRVDFVVAKNGKLTRYLEEFQRDVKDLVGPPLDQLVGTFTPGSMPYEPGIQAADFLLWHMQRYFARTMSLRHEFNLALLGDTSGVLQEYSEADMQVLGERLVTRALESKTAQDAAPSQAAALNRRRKVAKAHV
jgi:hypothetical protein